MARNFGRIESFIGIEAVRGCITPSLRERPPERQWRYYGFVDPSGGSSDSMTLAVSHRKARRLFWTPLGSEAAVFAGSYG
jgi:hypothetical protein